MTKRRFHLILDVDMLDAARAVARKRGQTLSGWIRGLIADALARSDA